MRKIVLIGATLAFMLSAGITASAGHHAACAGRVIHGSGLCQYTESHDDGHHLSWHDGGWGCAYWGIDVDGVCDNWDYCHGGAQAVYGQQGAAAQSQPAVSTVSESQPAAGAAGGQAGADATAQSQPEVSTVPESQPVADSAAGSQAGNGTGTVGESYYGGNGGYGYGGHHDDWHHSSGSYQPGCHGSGHHGRGHH